MRTFTDEGGIRFCFMLFRGGGENEVIFHRSGISWGPGITHTMCIREKCIIYYFAVFKNLVWLHPMFQISSVKRMNFNYKKILYAKNRSIAIKSEQN